MKKSLLGWHCYPRNLMRKTLIVMKLTLCIIVLAVMQLNASVFSQVSEVTLKMHGESLEDALKELKKQTNLDFFYSLKELDVNKKVEIDVEKIPLKEVLENLVGESYSFEFYDNIVVIRPVKRQIVQQQEKIIKGKVLDAKTGEPLPGVSVIAFVGDKDITGSATGMDGDFTLSLTEGVKKLRISMIGYKTQIINIDNSKVYEIKLVEDISELDEVVVTGYFERSKSTFTGSAKTVTGEELRKVSSSSIFKSLAVVDPSIVVMENNQQGSNPNHIPELIIRGTTSLNASNEAGANSPLIVIDGVESSLQELYDMDIFDIESLTVLKDASATALYGEQASNGVILITRKKSTQKEVRVNYNFSGKVDFPDLSDYSLMNARQKLELERLAGLYDSSTGEYDIDYNEKLARVNSGINTDWIAKPLRTAFSQNHSVKVTGRGSGMSYGLSARYGNNQGVMKDDFRKNLGVGVYFSYNLNDKLIATLRGDYYQNDTKGSRYGNFEDYTKANPYDSPYESDGDLTEELSYGVKNPLYEASLSSFSKAREKSFTTSLDLRWNIMPGLYVKGSGNIEGTEYRSDSYISPKSYVFSSTEDPAQKGRYTISANNNYNYYLKGSVNFNKNLDEIGSMVTVNMGGELRKEELEPYSFSSLGFFNDILAAPGFASQFDNNWNSTEEASESSNVGAFIASNLVYRNRYFVEGSFRISGSSKFGTNQRYAPFWSVGGGWNLHRESFMDYDWINTLRIRGSYGYTGKINFAAYQAITTYKYFSNLVNKYGNGANPIKMGNEDLKWETTKSLNLGLTSTFFDNRLNLNFDIYKNRTVDMIVPISMPPSSGTSEVNNNVGEQENKGFELTLSGMIIKKEDINWRLNFNLATNKSKLIEIGNSLVNRNDINAANSYNVSPLRMFVEGKSPTMIYVVRSAGIDPASGREIYIKKDGRYTYDYDPMDKVAVGDEAPKLRGAASSYFTWKNFTLGINTTYSLGGYIYNTTRVSRIEQIDPRYNADSRAFTDRWKKPGDVVKYLTIVANSEGINNYNHSSRFVEKESYLNVSSITLNYEFTSEAIKKLGFKRLMVGVDVNEPFRFSTVAQERGLYYPFARGFSFTISPTF